MRLVIADTGPVNYLILIGHIDVLPRMFERVVLPTTVQSWIADSPAWLEIAQTPAPPLLTGIHKGEAAAIALAVAMHADLLLMDDRRGRYAAKQQGLSRHRYARRTRSCCRARPGRFRQCNPQAGRHKLSAT